MANDEYDVSCPVHYVATPLLTLSVVPLQGYPSPNMWDQ